jgi:hypothetical protein
MGDLKNAAIYKSLYLKISKKQNFWFSNLSSATNEYEKVENFWNARKNANILNTFIWIWQVKQLIENFLC